MTFSQAIKDTGRFMELMQRGFTAEEAKRLLRSIEVVRNLPPIPLSQLYETRNDLVRRIQVGPARHLGESKQEYQERAERDRRHQHTLLAILEERLNGSQESH